MQNRHNLLHGGVAMNDGFDAQFLRHLLVASQVDRAVGDDEMTGESRGDNRLLGSGEELVAFPDDKAFRDQSGHGPVHGVVLHAQLPGQVPFRRQTPTVAAIARFQPFPQQGFRTVDMGTFGHAELFKQ